MHLWEFNACVVGYRNHLKELLSIGVYTGSYAGYYHPLNKHKKDPSVIVKRLFARKRSARKPDVDVAKFQALEQAFDANYRGGNKDGRKT